MNTPLRSTLRGTLVVISLLSLFTFVAHPARAIQLRWSTGATDLYMSQNTQAILVVQADSAEATLPNTWRLQWTADTSLVEFSAFEPNSACLVDTAKVDSVAQPSTPADSAANQVTAYFCSSGSTNATTAYFLVDLTANGHGKMRILALDPNDTTQVVESNEATYNGGVDGDFGPSIASVQTSHSTSTLELYATGGGLAHVTSASLGAPNNAWSVPLTITSATDSSLIASAEIATPLPVSVLTLAGRSGTTTSPQLGAETVVEPASIQLPLSVRYSDPDSLINGQPGAFPKDFTFTYSYLPNPWRVMYHLYYIRAFNTATPTDTTGVVLAHAWSYDLINWRVNRAAFCPRARWDCRHIWAPTIITRPDGVFMVYAAVGSDGNQGIGVASRQVLDSTDVDGTVWTRDSAAVLTLRQLGLWAKRANGSALRDPWVTEYPPSSGTYLMMYVAQDSIEAHGANVVGVAHSAVNLRSWIPGGYYRQTAVEDNSWGVSRIEAPMAFRDPATVDGWVLMYSDGGQGNGKNLRIERAGTTAALDDTSAGSWSIVGKLYDYVGSTNGPYTSHWQGSEQFRLGKFDYFAAWDGSGINISRMLWNGGVFSLSGAVLAGAEPATPMRERFFVLGPGLGASKITFGVESLRRERGQIDVFDVGGRLVRRVFAGDLLAGTSTVTWRCNDGAGGRVGPGVYFARCSRVGRQQTVKVVVAY